MSTTFALLAAATMTATTFAVIGPASAAAAAPTCEPWRDANTYGVSCIGRAGTAYMAVALCRNGRTVTGRPVGGSSGAWSYAYCTSVNSSLRSGRVEWFL